MARIAAALAATFVALGAIGGALVPIGEAAWAEEIYPLVFPVAGPHRYADTWGAARSGGRTHAGTDILADKGVPVVAAASGTVYWMHDERGGRCCALGLRHDDGWVTWYIHLDNDTPGTDDGQGWGFAPGIAVGVHVMAGQTIGYVGDSGNAEWTAPHLHFELHRPDGTAINPYASLLAAQGVVASTTTLVPTTTTAPTTTVPSTTTTTTTLASTTTPPSTTTVPSTTTTTLAPTTTVPSTTTTVAPTTTSPSTTTAQASTTTGAVPTSTTVAPSAATTGHGHGEVTVPEAVDPVDEDDTPTVGSEAGAVGGEAHDTGSPETDVPPRVLAIYELSGVEATAVRPGDLGRRSADGPLPDLGGDAVAARPSPPGSQATDAMATSDVRHGVEDEREGRVSRPVVAGSVDPSAGLELAGGLVETVVIPIGSQVAAVAVDEIVGRVGAAADAAPPALSVPGGVAFLSILGLTRRRREV